MHLLGRRTLEGELLQRSFPAGVGELQEQGQALELVYFVWKARNRRIYTFTHEFNTVKVRSTSKLNLALSAGQDTGAATALQLSQKGPDSPVLPQHPPKWHLCNAAAPPHFPFSASLSIPSSSLLLPPALLCPASPSPAQIPLPKPPQQTWH